MLQQQTEEKTQIIQILSAQAMLQPHRPLAQRCHHDPQKMLRSLLLLGKTRATANGAPTMIAARFDVSGPFHTNHTWLKPRTFQTQNVMRMQRTY